MENTAPGLPAAETDEPSLSVLPAAPNAEVLPDTPAANSGAATGRKRKPRGKMFTKENAREFAKRGAAARLRMLEARKDAAKMAGDNLPPTLATERLQMMCEQIAHTRRVLNGKLAPRDRAQLLLALDRLLERERILRGIPLPGSRRPGRERPQTSKPGAVAQGPLD